MKFLKSIPVVLRKPRLHTTTDVTANSDTAATRAPLPAAARLALQPQQPQYLGEFAGNCGNPRHLLGAADLGNNTPGSSVHAISACGRNPSA
jgi:hypothetical protein